MLSPRRRSAPFFIILAVLVIVLLYRRNALSPRKLRPVPSVPLNGQAAPGSPADVTSANSTLGFGAIVVVSKDGSSRLPAMIQAANVTGLDLTIPSQPTWTDDDVATFRNGIDAAKRGSILAWMGHRNAMEWFLDSDLETALILEDDVDWDIRLRSSQVPLAAAAARSMVPPPTKAAKRDQYWGDIQAWDLLYIGHCGDFFSEITSEGLSDETYDLNRITHTRYRDPSLLNLSNLHPYTASLFGSLHITDQTRVLHRSQFPLCTFGYAVTRPAAERLLNDLAPPKLRQKGPTAYDIALLHACRAGMKTPSPTPPKNPYPHPNPKLREKYASPGLRCWTLNPELFHHMPGESEIAVIQMEEGDKLGVPPVDLAGMEQVSMRQESSNIACGFWGGYFSFEDNDNERLSFLQEEVGKKGKCLKPGRELS